MAEKKPVILIVEDDLDIAEMLDAYFRVQGYDVYVSNWGEDGVDTCQTKQPDLVILDIRLPDIDGYEVANRLRNNRRTKSIPIIFLTEKRSRSERIQGLELGADDYITKPFDIQELRLRVRNSMKRSKLGFVYNPVTNLPEGSLIDERLFECLEDDSWALMLISLENLENFREAYGFVASDDVLRAISLMVQNAVRKYGSPGNFVGQINPSQFLVISTPDELTNLGDHISSRLEQSFDYFYPLRDRDTSKMHDSRLAVWISSLLPESGPFNDLDHLKAALYQSKI